VPALGAICEASCRNVAAGGVRSMAILHGAPVRIVLTGDSTVALGGGWGRRLLRHDDAQRGVH